VVQKENREGKARRLEPLTAEAARCLLFPVIHAPVIIEPPFFMDFRVVLRWNCAKVIANIDDLAISIWAPKVIDELSQIDDI
jgi:hypothetical protein